MNSLRFMLEAFLGESREYRGETAVTFKALTELILGKPGRPGILGRPPKPEGEAFDCKHPFDPTIWKGWYSLSTALQGASDIKTGTEFAGAPQGVHVVKKNYGGRVTGAPGKAKTDFERLPSSMDRYDVLMQGEITSQTRPDKKTKSMKTVSSGMLLRMAYAPSIGSSDERAARLQALMSGQQPAALPRRPQPERPGVVPDPTKQDPDSNDPYWNDKVKASVPDAPRAGTAGRMGLGHKQRADYRKTSDEDDED